MDIQTKPGLSSAFTYHPPKPEQIPKYGIIRDSGGTLAMVIFESCPRSDEKEIALQKVREAVMWANASIACNE